jgi:hypothetical protein
VLLPLVYENDILGVGGVNQLHQQYDLMVCAWMMRIPYSFFLEAGPRLWSFKHKSGVSVMSHHVHVMYK